jgi:hypothetical protein
VIRYHHYIPKLSCNNPLYIFRFLQEHGDDPAVVVGLPIPIVHLQVAHDNLNLQVFFLTNTFCTSSMHLPNGSYTTFGGNSAICPLGTTGSVYSGMYVMTYED